MSNCDKLFSILFLDARLFCFLNFPSIISNILIEFLKISDSFIVYGVFHTIWNNFLPSENLRSIEFQNETTYFEKGEKRLRKI